jgi:transcription elongation GreA/GreB family factor
MGWSGAEGEGKMTQKSQLEAVLKVGDRVRLIAETLPWKTEKALQGQIADVIELRDNGRISVRFDNGRLLLGREADSFERVAGHGPKAKGK